MAAPAPPAPPTALVLTSSRSLADLGCALASARGWSARAVTDGLAFARAYAEGPWGLVLLDLDLAWAPAEDTARALRARWPDLALHLWGEGGEAARRALQLGARDLLPPTVEGLALLAAALPPALPEGASAAPAAAELEALQAEVDALRAAASLSQGELQRRAAELAHDLHEPLRSLRDLGQRLADRLSTAGDAEGMVLATRLSAAAARLQALVGDSLDPPQAPADLGPDESADGQRVLREVIESLAAMIEETGGVVTHGPLPELGVPAHQLRRILQNLVSNALRHGGQPPEVHVTAERGAPGWILTVRDNGPGVPPEERARIFARGERGAAARGEGLGLGLSIVQRLAERAGGRAWVEDAVPRGSRFRVALPGDRILDEDATARAGPATKLEDTRPIPLTRQASKP